MSRRTMEELTAGIDWIGDKPRKVANNTISYRQPDGALVTRLHLTNIIVIHTDGRIVLDSGGWQTSTTKDRMRCVAAIWSDRGIWYLIHGGEEYPYADGMTLYPKGRVEYANGEPPNPKALKKLRRRVKAYAWAYANALFAGEVGRPGNGDCLICVWEGSKERRETKPSADHMLSHLDESYFVPRIIYTAMETFGASQALKQTIAAQQWGSTNPWPNNLMQQQARKLIEKHCYASLRLSR